jgi:hypothetical protein
VPQDPAAQDEIQKLEAELGSAFSARQIQDLQSRIGTLESQVANWQATFAQYQLLLGDTGTNVLTVIESASLPEAPVSSNWMLQVALAAAIGVGLALGAAFLIEYLDDTVRSSQDLERLTGRVPMGIITKIPGQAPAEKLVAARYPKSPITEAYRGRARTALPRGRPVRSLVVTSTQARRPARPRRTWRVWPKPKCGCVGGRRPA